LLRQETRFLRPQLRRSRPHTGHVGVPARPAIRVLMEPQPRRPLLFGVVAGVAADGEIPVGSGAPLGFRDDMIKMPLALQPDGIAAVEALFALILKQLPAKQGVFSAAGFRARPGPGLPALFLEL